MTRRRLSTLIAATALALPLAAVPLAPAPASAAVGALATSFTIPWALAPLPDGSALMTERESARVWRVFPRGGRALVTTVSGVRASGEGGLLGIVAAPDFARTRQYFVYYTAASDNRVARMTYGSSAAPVPIVTGIPKGNIHNGGGLVFNSTGSALYIGTGDAGDRDLAQSNASLGGKVLRVTRTGAGVRGNLTGRIATKGHRNVQGLTFTSNGLLWASELGQDAFDEVNRISVGRNYGWPVVEGRSTDTRFVNPAKVWAPEDASPSGITARDTTLHVAALRGQRLWRLTTSGVVVTSARASLQGTYGRLRAVSARTDGSLWMTTSNGGGQDRVLKVTPAP